MNTVEALEKGRDFLKENKWGRGSYKTADGAYCAVGALYCGAYGPEYWNGATEEYSDYNEVRTAEFILNEVAPNKSATQFNDHGAKRKRDVISLYNKAIKQASQT